MGLGRFNVLGTPYRVVPLLKKDIIRFKETKKKTGPRVNKCVIVAAFLLEKGMFTAAWCEFKYFSQEKKLFHKMIRSVL